MRNIFQFNARDNLKFLHFFFFQIRKAYILKHHCYKFRKFNFCLYGVNSRLGSCLPGTLSGTGSPADNITRIAASLSNSYTAAFRPFSFLSLALSKPGILEILDRHFNNFIFRAGNNGFLCNDLWSVFFNQFFLFIAMPAGVFFAFCLNNVRHNN